VPLRVERVVEVKYDYLQDGRFRHAATFLRWREDKRPEECTFEQVDVPAEADVQAELYGSK
jgi:ATP-dependent DNA ligase